MTTCTYKFGVITEDGTRYVCVPVVSGATPIVVEGDMDIAMDAMEQWASQALLEGLVPTGNEKFDSKLYEVTVEIDITG